jgi:hypothetical protein
MFRKSIHWVDIWNVLKVTAFIVYSWAIVIILYDIPEMILRLSVIEIVGFVSYQFVFSLLETIVVTGIVVGLGFLLPIKTAREHFAVSTGLISVTSAFVATLYKVLPHSLYLINQATGNSALGRTLQILIVIVWITLMFLSLFISPLAASNKTIRKVFEMLFERLSPLVTLYLLISAISIPVVFLRNG